MSLEPVDREELEIGKPLPWDLLDPQNRPILARGASIGTPEELAGILARSPCRAASPPATDAWSEDDRSGGKGGREDGFSFEEMRLKVGDRLQLQPPHHLSADRFIVRLVGYLANTSLMVTAPYANGLRLPLLGNERIVLRAFTTQNAFAFNCAISKICKLPFDYLHLTFPTEIRGAVVRKAPRVNTRIVTTVANSSRNEASENMPGVIANISASGARLDARRKLGEVGDGLRLFFRLNLHDVATYLTTDAVVRSIFVDDPAPDGDPSLIHHGVEFRNLQANDSVILKSFIYQQMIEQPGTLTGC